jgi:hypothetical protein
MSEIGHMMKSSTQSAPEAKPIEKPGGGFNAAPPTSKNDLADGQSEKLRATATTFPSRPTPSACRPPLFRR